MGSPVNFFQAIAAMSENRVIGRDNGLPWHLPEDLDWFRNKTTGNIVIMGRKTFALLGRPLPARLNIVLSRSGARFDGVRVISSLAKINPSQESREIFICGGEEVYRSSLPFCSDLFLTLVKRRVEGDKFFPAFEDRFTLAKTVLERPEFLILHYRNPQPLSCHSENNE
jgi:dihydrofolate reductase